MAIGLNRDFFFPPGLEHGITKRIKRSFGFGYGKSFRDPVPVILNGIDDVRARSIIVCCCAVSLLRQSFHQEQGKWIFQTDK